MDDDIRELFEVEKRTSDDLQVVALPTSGTVDQDAHNFLVSQQLAALVSLTGEQTAMIDELQSMETKIDGKTDKIDGTTNQILDIQIEYSGKMSEMYRQSKALQEIVAAYRAEHVQLTPKD